MTPGWEERTTGTPVMGPVPPTALRLKTWLDPVLVRLTDTGVGDTDAMDGADG